MVPVFLILTLHETHATVCLPPKWQPHVGIFVAQPQLENTLLRVLVGKADGLIQVGHNLRLVHSMLLLHVAVQTPPTVYNVDLDAEAPSIAPTSHQMLEPRAVLHRRRPVIHLTVTQKLGVASVTIANFRNALLAVLTRKLDNLQTQLNISPISSIIAYIPMKNWAN